MSQYALIIDGVVNGIADKPRSTTVGSWLPLVEDPTTYSPYGDRVPWKYKVLKTKVARYWQARPAPPSRAEIDALNDAVTKVALHILAGGDQSA